MAQFKNRYFGSRHGSSRAMEAGIILSDPQEGAKPEWGLIEKGRAEVRESASAAKEVHDFNNGVKIYSSPLSRAKETAEIIGEVLDASTPIQVDERLRERWFGDFDGKNNRNYETVWDYDSRDPRHTHFGVESAHKVKARGMSFVMEMEETHAGETIIMVSHGDFLQITQTGFQEISAALHRTLFPIKPGEIREFIRAATVRATT